MLQIKRYAFHETIFEYAINFDTNTNGGYSFECDENGKVNIEGFSSIALENYNKCINGEIKTIKPPYIKTYSRRVYNPAVATCDCGEEIELDVDSEGLCYCNCGNCYNGAGQSIRPRSEWEERYDDNY